MVSLSSLFLQETMCSFFLPEAIIRRPVNCTTESHRPQMKCTLTLMDLVTEAFPIVVFAKQLEDKSRKIMEIMECEILPTGERRYNTLYHFKIEENRLEDGKYRIKGRHEAVNPISESLQKRFIDNGMPQEVLTQLVGKKSAPSKGKSGSSPAKAGQATPAPKTRSAQSKPPAKPETGKEGGESV